MTSWNGIPLVENTTNVAIDTIYGPIVAPWIADGASGAVTSGAQANLDALETLVASGPVVAFKYHTAYTNVLEDAVQTSLTNFEDSVAESFEQVAQELAQKANLTDIPVGGLITITGSDSIIVTGDAATGFQLDLASGANTGSADAVNGRVTNLVDVLNRTLSAAADRIKYLEAFVSFIESSSLMETLGSHPNWTATINQIGWPPEPQAPALGQVVDLESGNNPFKTGTVPVTLTWRVGDGAYGNPPATSPPTVIVADAEGPTVAAEADPSKVIVFKVFADISNLEDADEIDYLELSTEDGDMLQNGSGVFTAIQGPTNTYTWSGSTTALTTSQTYVVTVYTQAGVSFISNSVTFQAVSGGGGQGGGGSSSDVLTFTSGFVGTTSLASGTTYDVNVPSTFTTMTVAINTLSIFSSETNATFTIGIRKDGNQQVLKVFNNISISEIVAKYIATENMTFDLYASEIDTYISALSGAAYPFEFDMYGIFTIGGVSFGDTATGTSVNISEPIVSSGFYTETALLASGVSLTLDDISGNTVSGPFGFGNPLAYVGRANNTVGSPFNYAYDINLEFSTLLISPTLPIVNIELDTLDSTQGSQFDESNILIVWYKSTIGPSWILTQKDILVKLYYTETNYVTISLGTVSTGLVTVDAPP